MPGANCSIYGCSTSRKKGGLAIFKMPSGNDDYNRDWKNKVVQIITRDREIDSNLKSQIERCTLHTCELHYTENCLNINPTKTTLIPGSLPTLNLPKKSFLQPMKARPSTNITKRELCNAEINSSAVSKTDKYNSLQDFKQRFHSLKLSSSWEMTEAENSISLKKIDKTFVIPKFQIVIENNLIYNILVYNWLIPKTNSLHTDYDSSIKNVTISMLIADINKSFFCKGVSYKTDAILPHIVPKTFTGEPMPVPIQSIEFLRPKECLILDCTERCKVCVKKEQSHSQYKKRKTVKLQEPTKPQAPISITSPDRLKLTIQNYRIENKELKNEMAKLRVELDKCSVKTSDSLKNDLVSIMSNADPSKVSPFMKFFWEEQQKYIQCSSTGVRYHPMIIRYCLSLATKSSSAYEDIRYNEKTGTGFLVLPSKRRLRDYKNYIHPQRGFNKHIIQELVSKVANFSEPERYVVLLLDEMKVQENLIWDKHTGELIGYVDLGDPAVNYATLQKVDSVATHILLFMLRSIINPFKFSLANFSTTGATGCQLFPLLWKAVGICELNDVKVLAVTCDGASSNRKLFDMHFKLQDDDDKSNSIDVTYRTPNVFSTDERYLYFIADQPHLIKTARNCLANSGDGKATRLMWNNGCFLMWNHVAQLFYEDLECGLHWFTRLTYDHIKLTPYSKMNVRLAAQVLSSNVAKIITNYGPPEARETGRFCAMMDKFFDIVNIRDNTQHILQQKPDRQPIKSPNDPRLTWLTTEFLSYFDSWLNSIETRPGKYDKTAKNKMFISLQTYEGIKITVHSIVECVRFLLNNHICSYVLTERFCQDPLENYFGRQRSLLSRKDNPSVRDVGYNDNAIRNTKVFHPIAGNVRGGDAASVEISNDPIPARKRAKQE